MTKDITKLIKEGKMDQARQKARILLAKESIAQQMDQAADMAELSVAQIQANNAMNRMTAMMQQSSKTMNRAQKQTNPERVRISTVMLGTHACPVAGHSLSLLSLFALLSFRPTSSLTRFFSPSRPS